MSKDNNSSGAIAILGAVVISGAGIISMGLSSNQTNTAVKNQPQSTPILKEISLDKICLIKGNINSKGEKIYHMPGQKYYSQTVINKSAGERWFCTEQEAINAGWRKSKV